MHYTVPRRALSRADPNIGNGYVGSVVGCFPSWVLPNGRVESGVFHVAGVFNGGGDPGEHVEGVSHRASIPGVYSVFPVAAGSADTPSALEPVEFVGFGIDLERAVVYNRSTLPGCSGSILEQRWYAHRKHRSLLVYEMELLLPDGSRSETAASSPLPLSPPPPPHTDGCVIKMATCNQQLPPSN